MNLNSVVRDTRIKMFDKISYFKEIKKFCPCNSFNIPA